MRRYAMEVDRLGRAYCKPHGLHPTDFQALGLIMEAETITPRELAEELTLSSGVTSAPVDRLEKTGHFTRGRREIGRGFLSPSANAPPRSTPTQRSQKSAHADRISRRPGTRPESL